MSLVRTCTHVHIHRSVTSRVFLAVYGWWRHRYRSYRVRVVDDVTFVRFSPVERVDIEVGLLTARVAHPLHTVAVHDPDQVVVLRACVALGGRHLKNHAHVADTLIDVFDFVLRQTLGGVESQIELVALESEVSHGFGVPEAGLAVATAGNLKWQSKNWSMTSFKPKKME